MKYVYLWFICLGFAGFFLYLEGLKRRKAAVVLKGLASLSFVILGLLGGRLSGNGVAAKNITAGLILGAIGDVVLSFRHVPTANEKKAFLAGSSMFLAGHVMYITALAPMCSCFPKCLAAAAVFTALLVIRVCFRMLALREFRIFGVFYLAAILIMTCTAVGLSITSAGTFSAIFASGALMFLASDLILIRNTFGPDHKECFRIANIIVYYIGQLLIATSLQFL